MSRLSIFTAVLLVAAGAAYAQGTVPDAVVVLDRIRVQVAASGTAEMTRTIHRRALSEDGADEVGTLRIPYNTARAFVSIKDARIVHPDGSGGPVPSTAITESAYPGTEHAPAYSGARLLTVRFPGVAVGDTVEVTYVERQWAPFTSGAFSLFQTFDRTLPIEQASMEITAPAGMPLRVQANNMQGGETSTAAPGRRAWRFTATHVPPLINVASVSERTAKSPFVIATTFASAEDAARAYLARVSKPSKVTLELQHLADDLAGHDVDTGGLMRHYYAWISDHLRLVPVPLQLAAPTPRAASDILLSGYGSSEDRVILLRALMAAKGMSTDLVLVPSKPVLWAPGVPAMPDFYGRVLLVAPGESAVLDIGAPIVDLGSFDPDDRGKSGLRVSPGGAVANFVVPSVDPRDAANALVTEGTLQPDGTLVGSTTVTAFSDLATAAAQAFATESPAELRRVLTRFGSEKAEVTLVAQGRASSDDLDDPDDRARYVYGAHFRVPGYAPTLFRTPAPTKHDKHPVPVLDVDHPGFALLPVPREFDSLSPIDEIAEHDDGLCRRTMRVQTIDLRLPYRADALTLPSNIEVGSAGGVAHYVARYELRGDTLHVQRALSLQASPDRCDQAQRQQLLAVIRAVRADMMAKIQVGH